MLAWIFFVLEVLAIYAAVGIGTYVLSYAPLYREIAALHETRECGCPCRSVIGQSHKFPERTVPAEWSKKRKQEYYTQQQHDRELFYEAELRGVEEKKTQLRTSFNRKYAKDNALIYAIMWPFAGTFFIVRFVFRQLRAVGGKLLIHPVQRMAEAPLIHEQKQEARRQEAAALRERFERDMQGGDGT